MAKVSFERVGNGPEQAMLSPLRFHYDSDAFNLPIRLGLINSGGTQDLVVTILAPGQRYEVANYDNVAIPTNIDVSDATRDAVRRRSTRRSSTRRWQKHPRSVVTEYSWSAYSCDPCPTPPLDASELQTLGADALPSSAPSTPAGGGAPLLPRRRVQSTEGFVVTRLHARYSKDALGDDLFFRAAPPIVGGREFVQTNGKLEQGARPDATNNFQARYAIRHPWTGPIACSHPQRGVWGGRPGSDPWSGGPPPVKPAARIAFALRSANATLATFVRGGLPPETFLSGGGATPPLLVNSAVPNDASAPGSDADAAAATDGEAANAASDAAAPPLPPTAPRTGGGCAGCTASPESSAQTTAGASLLALAVIAAIRLRRRTN